jgi:hypothetical protein
MKPYAGMTLRFDLLGPPAVEAPEARPPLGRLGWTLALLIGAQVGLRALFGYGGSVFFAPGRALPLDWTDLEKLVVGTVGLHGMADLALLVALLGALGLLLQHRRPPVALIGAVSLLCLAHSAAGLYLARIWVPAHRAGMTAEQLARLPATVPGNLGWMGIAGVALTAALVAVTATAAWTSRR